MISTGGEASETSTATGVERDAKFGKVEMKCVGTFVVEAIGTLAPMSMTTGAQLSSSWMRYLFTASHVGNERQRHRGQLQ